MACVGLVEEWALSWCPLLQSCTRGNSTTADWTTGFGVDPPYLRPRPDREVDTPIEAQARIVPPVVGFPIMRVAF